MIVFDEELSEALDRACERYWIDYICPGFLLSRGIAPWLPDEDDDDIEEDEEREERERKGQRKR